MSDIARDLAREAEAARALLFNIRDVIADDEAFADDAIEGETNLHDALAEAGERVLQCEAYAEAMKGRIAKLKARQDRWETQAELLRAAMLSAMATAGMKKLEREHVTVTRKPIAPSVDVFEAADVPTQFYQPQPPPPPKLDKAGLLRALKDLREGETIPGARLVTNRETVQIKGS